MPKYLVNLYQAYIKEKEKRDEMSFPDLKDPRDHLNYFDNPNRIDLTHCEGLK